MELAMAISRAKKKTYVEELHQELVDSETVVIAHYKGLSVAEISDLRKQMYDTGAKLRVTKNTLTRLALKDTAVDGVSDLFTGPTAVAYSKDPVAAAKVAVKFAKDNEKLVILGGALGNKRLSNKDVEALASMPSLDELRGRIIGLLNAPATKLAQLMSAPGGQLARVIQAKSQKS
jgi:large subunit ribosomal protein L10